MLQLICLPFAVKTYLDYFLRFPFCLENYAFLIRIFNYKEFILDANMAVLKDCKS